MTQAFGGKLSKSIIAGLVCILFFLGLNFAFAEPVPGPEGGATPIPSPQGGTTPQPGPEGGTTPSPSGGSKEIINPLKSTSITDFLLKVVDVVLIFLTPLIIFFIMYAGFLFVTAQGDTGKISTARLAITWAVIGGVVILGARALISIIEGTIKSF